MGSKNLKAIAVRGTRDIAVAKHEEFMDMVKEFHERMKGPAAQRYRTLGTVENLNDNKTNFTVCQHATITSHTLRTPKKSAVKY